MKNSILAIDIGGGTQDILLYDSEKNIENCFKLVLPSPTVMVAEEINHVTRQGLPLYLDGVLMGGGRSVRAIREHLVNGLPVAAHPLAARTIDDDLREVEDLGIELSEVAPNGYTRVRLGDLDLNRLNRALNEFGLKLPEQIGVAVQDHGESIEESNRVVRFQMWQDFINSGGNLTSLVYRQVPPKLTRMLAIQMECPAAVVMDTGPAALLGSLWDEQVANHAKQGLVMVNIGNQHTLAVRYEQGQVTGLFEHHTAKVTDNDIRNFVNRLIDGTLSNEEIFNSQGHGAIVSKPMKQPPFIVVTGPNRSKVKELGYYEAVPGGDMMISGCFGIIRGMLSIIS